MKKIAIVLALTAVMSAPAFADSTAVSAGASSANINGTNVPELSLGVTQQTGDYIGSIKLAGGSHNGTRVRQVNADFGRIFEVTDAVSVAPVVELGYDKINSFSAKHIAAGVDGMVHFGRVSLSGGVKAGRTFGVSDTGAAGTYATADVGVGYAVGAGIVSVSCDYTRMPLTSAANVSARRVTIGYMMVF